MSLADDVSAALPFLREQAESRMQDYFDAYAPGPGTDADGMETDAATVAKESTPGRVAGRSRDGDTNTRLVTIGGVERPVVEGGLHIPLWAEVPSIGWEYVLVELGPNTDPALLNRRWRVVDVPAKSDATARRLDVVEVP